MRVRRHAGRRRRRWVDVLLGPLAVGALRGRRHSGALLAWLGAGVSSARRARCRRRGGWRGEAGGPPDSPCGHIAAGERARLGLTSPTVGACRRDAHPAQPACLAVGGSGGACASADDTAQGGARADTPALADGAAEPCCGGPACADELPGLPAPAALAAGREPGCIGAWPCAAICACRSCRRFLTLSSWQSEAYLRATLGHSRPDSTGRLFLASTQERPAAGARIGTQPAGTAPGKKQRGAAPIFQRGVRGDRLLVKALGGGGAERGGFAPRGSAIREAPKFGSTTGY
jgi:hypothetical protein